MNSIKGIINRIAYFGLAIPMFYFVDSDITLGGFGIQYMYLFGMGIIALAVISFLIKPKFQNMILGLKYTGVFLSPYLWTLIYSFFLWAVTTAAMKTITRGFFYAMYQVIAVLVAFSTIYLFGGIGIFYQLAAMVCANMIFVFQSILANGPVNFLSEYIDLIVSFTGNTGSIMKSFEGYGYSFPYAIFLTYFLLDFKENKKRWYWLPLVTALFFLGLKRSVFFSMLAAVAVGLFMKLVMKKKAKKFFCIFFSVGVVASVCYIIAVHAGLFDWLESMGVDTMGRNWISATVHDLYEVSIGYFGQGVGYVSGSLATEEIKLINEGYRVYEIHNDLLRVYIEMGMIGYIIWSFLFLRYRAGYFFHGQKNERDNNHGILTSCLIVTLYVTFTTDNTYYYYYTTLFQAMAIMSFHFDEYAREIPILGEEEMIVPPRLEEQEAGKL